MDVITPWKHFRRVGGNPFSSLGLDWCPKCKSEVDTDTKAGHQSGVYVYKRSCRACGTVIKSGMFCAPLIGDENLLPVALQWVTSPEKDRR
jgi:hypothetical protein